MPSGAVAERTNAPVLKTGDPQGFEGSNPSRSARGPAEGDARPNGEEHLAPGRRSAHRQLRGEGLVAFVEQGDRVHESRSSIGASAGADLHEQRKVGTGGEHQRRGRT